MPKQAVSSSYGIWEWSGHLITKWSVFEVHLHFFRLELKQRKAGARYPCERGIIVIVVGAPFVGFLLGKKRRNATPWLPVWPSASLSAMCKNLQQTRQLHVRPCLQRPHVLERCQVGISHKQRNRIDWKADREVEQLRPLKATFLAPPKCSKQLGP